MNFGVIGAGGIALRKTIPAVLRAENSHLVAVMDTRNVDRIAAELGVLIAYANETALRILKLTEQAYTSGRKRKFLNT